MYCLSCCHLILFPAFPPLSGGEHFHLGSPEPTLWIVGAVLPESLGKTFGFGGGSTYGGAARKTGIRVSGCMMHMLASAMRACRRAAMQPGADSALHPVAIGHPMIPSPAYSTLVFPLKPFCVDSC